MPIGARQTMASITYKLMKDPNDFSDISPTADNFAMRNGSRMEQLLVWSVCGLGHGLIFEISFNYYFRTEGTEAWIDALGYMRHKQYIADKDGYRILKSKTIYVGKSPIRVRASRLFYRRAPPLEAILINFSFLRQDVITNGRINSKFNSPSTTSLPPVPNAIEDSGYSYERKKVPDILVHYNSEPIDGRFASPEYIPPSSTIAPPVTTYRPISLFTSPSPTTALPISSSSAAYISSTTLAPPTSTPRVEIHSAAIAEPSKYFLPPLDSSPIVAINPVNVPTQIPVEQINNELEAPSPVSVRVPITLAPTIATNEITDSRLQYYGTHISSTVSPIAAVISTDRSVNANLNVQPLFDRNSFYRNRPANSYQYYQPNQLDANTNHFERYNAQSPNGFGYFLPRQYHEERYRDPQNRDGSFGYIDPFGIRRDVYYQTSPESGFKIRKNNRYVGFNANPYDSK